MRFVRNRAAMRAFEDKARRAFLEMADEMRDDVVASGTMPIESGFLQDDATTVCGRRLRQNRLAIVTDTVYARRKYFNPQFDFNRSVNRAAGGRWFDTYVGGAKRHMARDIFVRQMRKRGA